MELLPRGPSDMLIQVSAINRGSGPATVHVLPTLWFRNSGRGGRTRQRRRLIA